MTITRRKFLALRGAVAAAPLVDKWFTEEMNKEVELTPLQLTQLNGFFKEAYAVHITDLIPTNNALLRIRGL